MQLGLIKHCLKILILLGIPFLQLYFSYRYYDRLWSRDLYQYYLTRLLDQRKAYLPSFHNQHDVKCRRLISGDKHIIAKTSEVEQNLKDAYDIYISNVTQQQVVSCYDVYRQSMILAELTTNEEKNYPIAFSFIVYRNFPQFLQLFLTLYRPHNVYCVHVDSKSDVYFTSSVRKLAACFDNVIVPNHTARVVWSQFSVLEAEIICIQQLIKRSGWKYFINLTGQDFPLKTNLEIVRVLKAFNGSNNMEGKLNQ